MKRKSIILLSGLILLLVAIIHFGIRNSKDKDLRVEQYFPNIKMTKEFSGGFENAGFYQIVDRFKNNKIQVKQYNTGTGVVLIYQISNNDIKLIYSREGESFEENYIDNVVPNTDEIILKAPLKLGTKWVSSRGGSYEITGVNVKVFTSVGMFYAVEVTYKDDEFQSRDYYVKNLGLIKRSIKGHGHDNLLKIKYSK